MNSSNIRIIVFSILGVIVLAGAILLGYFAGKLDGLQNAQTPSPLPGSVVQEDNKTEMAPSVAPATTPSTTSQQGEAPAVTQNPENQQPESSTTAPNASSGQTDTPAAAPVTPAQNTTPQAGQITEDQALEIALADAGVSQQDAQNVIIQQDYSRGQMHYDVDFYTANRHYEYEVNATSGAILSRESEHSNTPAQTIGQQAAIDAALAHAGVSQSQVSHLQTEADLNDRTPHYSVEFVYNGTEYEYEIGASDGSILKHETDRWSR